MAERLRPRRIAVIVSHVYRGGTLRAAKLVAEALLEGSRNAGEEAQIVFAYPAPEADPESGWDRELHSSIAPRSIQWKHLEAATAARAMRYSGHLDWTPSAPSYVVPDDGIQQLGDCDLWILVSDRVFAPLLPVRPYLLLAYDYCQRYDSYPLEGNSWFLQAARAAQRVLVTTRFTELDALGYAGVERSKVVRVPILAPEFGMTPPPPTPGPYFLWVTNLARHKNHINAMLGLREYYESLDGQLDCHISGPETGRLLTSDMPHLKPLALLVSQSETLSAKVKILGELPDAEYRTQLASATFLWHAARIDNGTFSVVEAAYLGVPALSSRYPAMEEMDEHFELNLNWMDAREPADMARQLKRMEEHSGCARSRLPAPNRLAIASVRNVASEYWRMVRECL